MMFSNSKQLDIRRLFVNVFLVTGLRLHLLKCLLSNVRFDLPCCEDMTLGEDLLNLFKSSALRLGEAEEDVNERCKIEGPENEISLIRDAAQARGNRPCKREIEKPV